MILIICLPDRRADTRFAPSQWETSLQSNAVSHWLGANLESALRPASKVDPDSILLWLTTKAKKKAKILGMLLERSRLLFWYMQRSSKLSTHWPHLWPWGEIPISSDYLFSLHLVRPINRKCYVKHVCWDLPIYWRSSYCWWYIPMKAWDI